MKLLRLAVAAALVLAPCVLADPAGAAVSDEAGSVSLTTTLTRAHLESGGRQTVVDTRNIALKVSQTRNLHSRQPIEVSWTGAHPTGGIVPDDTSSVARLQEYPFVLLECRGTKATITPSTCWTQSVQERFTRDGDTGFPAWRVDRKAVPAERKAIVGAPTPRPAKCGSPAAAEHWLPFASVSGTVYNTNLTLCGTQAPEVSNVGGSGAPSNTQYAQTEKSGKGSTTFTTWTQEDNASLGCSETVPCALVAVPIMGVSCDETATALPAEDRPPASTLDAVSTACRSTGNYAPGAPNQNGAGNALSVSGSLWWAASNWSGHLTVPLEFAPAANACDLTSGGKGIDVYGSETLVAATTSWRPARCLGKAAHPFKHVQVGEPQARNLLANGTIPAAFLSFPPKDGWSSPVVSSPTAVSGFSISYSVDDASGSRYRNLKLDARLIAKLLTQSYPAANFVKSEYAALHDNPLNITLDPEFIALNPGLTKGVTDSAAASELFSLSSDSDVVTALTSYLQADADARAFLDGKADPWGMVVNPSYKGIALPVESWPQRDSFEPKGYYASGQNECLQGAPVPYLPLVASPTARLSSIALALQYGLSNPQIVCVAVPGLADGQGSKLVAEGRQQPGFRFLLGVTSLGDASRYALDSAALQVHGPTGAPAFTSAAGRTFVAPTPAGLRAATAFLKPVTSGASWQLDVPGLLASTAPAYPGTMPIYTAVATKGLSPSTAAAYASFLRFVAGDAQRPGLEIGQLPDGYLPLTAANGLTSMRAYAAVAADAVAAQKGLVPALDYRAPAVVTAPAVVAPAAPPVTVVPPAASLPVTAPRTVGPASPFVAPLTAPALAPAAAPLAVGVTPPLSTSGTLTLPILLGAGVAGALATSRRRRAA